MGKGAAIQISSKDEIREVLGRSPDKGDSVAMTFVDDLPAPTLIPGHGPRQGLQDRVRAMARGGRRGWDQSAA
ncbi:hypothetical protein ACHFCA_17325 [Delftia tsuruhatensis]